MTASSNFDSLVLVAETPDAVATWKELQSAAKARSLRISVGDGEFIMVIVCLSDLLAHASIGSPYQKKSVDMRTARYKLTNTVAALNA